MERTLVGGMSWPGIVQGVPKWVSTELESWKAIIETIEEQLDKIEAELRAAAPRRLIFGEGELAHELLARELIDEQRSQQLLGGQLLWALPE